MTLFLSEREPKFHHSNSGGAAGYLDPNPGRASAGVESDSLTLVLLRGITSQRCHPDRFGIYLRTVDALLPRRNSLKIALRRNFPGADGAAKLRTDISKYAVIIVNVLMD
jgi:hypothetical protein